MWTPIAEEAARATRVLHPDNLGLPRPTRRRIIVVANQKGGVGKTTSDGEHRRGARAARAAGCSSSTSTRRATRSTGLGVPHHAGIPSVYDVLIGEHARWPRRLRPATESPNLCCVPGDDRPRRRRDRAGLGGGPRVRGSREALSSDALAEISPTTSSSTARRRSAC